MKRNLKPKKKKEEIKHIPKVEIFFHNLDKETQKALLKLYGISDPREMNWDIVPVAIIERLEFIEE